MMSQALTRPSPANLHLRSTAPRPFCAARLKTNIARRCAGPRVVNVQRKPDIAAVSDSIEHKSFFSSFPLIGAAPELWTLSFVLFCLNSSIDAASAADLQNMDSSSFNSLMDVAEGQEFWSNMARYGRFFITVMLGTGTVMVRPFAQFFKNPISAVLFMGFLSAFIYFIKFTIEAMVGLSEPVVYTFQ